MPESADDAVSLYEITHVPRYVVIVLALLASTLSFNAAADNVDIAISTEHGEAFLIFKNAKPETAASVTSVRLLVPEARKKSQANPVEIFHGRTPVGDVTRLSLGPLTQLIAKAMPGAPVDAIYARHPQIGFPGSPCVSCDSRGMVAFQVIVDYGFTQRIVSVASPIYMDP